MRYLMVSPTPGKPWILLVPARRISSSECANQGGQQLSIRWQFGLPGLVPNRMASSQKWPIFNGSRYRVPQRLEVGKVRRASRFSQNFWISRVWMFFFDLWQLHDSYLNTRVRIESPIVGLQVPGLMGRANMMSKDAMIHQRYYHDQSSTINHQTSTIHHQSSFIIILIIINDLSSIAIININYPYVT